jgi:undecaprenyl-diphosphatase
LFAAVALVLVAVPFGLLLLLVRDRWRPLLRLDNGVSADLHRYAVEHAGFVEAMNGLSRSGSTEVWLAVVALVAGWLAWRRLPRLAVFAVVTVSTSSVLNNAVKSLVDRARPVLPDPVARAGGFSFPSGHAQAAMVGYAMLLMVFLPALRGVWRGLAVTVATVMVVAVGFSRVALGVHYVSDVLAGYALGAAWVAAMAAVFNAWRVDRGKRPAAPGEGLEPEQAERLGAHDPGHRDPDSGGTAA